MAHELSFINGIAEFAYLTGTPVWHGFGQVIPEDQAHNIDAWLYASNMGNWSIKTAPVLAYDADDDELITFDGRKLLYRSDTKQPLADVGYGYNVVQPAEVVRFFDGLINSLNFKMRSCGVLFGGRKFWAQADIGQSINILGKDRVDGMLLLSTSCDGSMATTATYTTVRVVCNNTLRMATGSDSDYVKMSHQGVFSQDDFRTQLGITPDAFIGWGNVATEMAKYKITAEEAVTILSKALLIPEEQDPMENRQIAKTLQLFAGQALGSDMAPDSLWQLVNATTEYADHWRQTKSMDSRINSAWFGQQANIKDAVWQEAYKMVA